MNKHTQKFGTSTFFSELVRKTAKMSRPEVQSAIDACHPCTLETDEARAADALAMELIQGRHDKRDIVNMLRWVLMGCPSDYVVAAVLSGDLLGTFWRHKKKGGIYHVTELSSKRGDVYLRAETPGCRSTWKAECLLPLDYEQVSSDRALNP